VSGVLLLTPHEAFFHRCTKCCVFKVWLQLHVILCHHEGYLLLANFGASGNCGLLLCLGVMQYKTRKGGKEASRS